MEHNHSHHAHHHHSPDATGTRLFWAIVINLGLSLVQITGGMLTGSLALVADGVHNLSDAGALVIAFAAKKIAGLPSDAVMTFGYGRAEILGALINSVSLLLVGLYLLYEASRRFTETTPIEGWPVIIIASVALVVDLATAWLTHKGSKESVNMRAVFIHNLTDALASVAVIGSGIAILLYQLYWVDLLATLVISAYVIFHSWALLKTCIRTLMQGVPEELNIEEIKEKLTAVTGVVSVHHIHVWQVHERFRTFEAHIVIGAMEAIKLEALKRELKGKLKADFNIQHSTLEFEFNDLAECHDGH